MNSGSSGSSGSLQKGNKNSKLGILFSFCKDPEDPDDPEFNQKIVQNNQFSILGHLGLMGLCKKVIRCKVLGHRA